MEKGVATSRRTVLQKTGTFKIYFFFFFKSYCANAETSSYGFKPLPCSVMAVQPRRTLQAERCLSPPSAGFLNVSSKTSVSGLSLWICIWFEKSEAVFW